MDVIEPIFNTNGAISYFQIRSKVLLDQHQNEITKVINKCIEFNKLINGEQKPKP